MQKVSYKGNGVTTEFYFNFPYFNSTNILVTKNTKRATGYHIIGTSGGINADIPFTGGKVVFERPPSSLDTITIARKLPLDRVVDYQPSAKLNPMALNQDMNYLMEVLKDFDDKLETLSEQYSDIANKESAKNLLDKIITVTNKINDFDDKLENDSIMLRDDFYAYTTNCITKIPQHIKLELNNGTLTLKEGSIVYRPNGIGVFIPVTTPADKTVTESANGTYMLCSWGLSTIYLVPIANCFSAATKPTGFSGAAVWYDTTNNIIRATYDGGATWDGTLVFPMAVITVSNGKISAINNVFNGFGYIGNCVFTLPGLRGLYPNGRNPDGTLKNGTINCTTVQVSSLFNDTDKHVLMISANGRCQWYGTNGCYYDKATNILYKSSDNVILASATVGTFDTTSGRISNFNPNTVLHIPDYNQ